MFKKIIDATVAFFKGPQIAPVVPEAPYKIEVPVTDEVVSVIMEVTAPVEPVPVAPVVETVKKPRKAKEPDVKKPAAKKVPAKKTTKPKD
jgi:hypothetical protein